MPSEDTPAIERPLRVRDAVADDAEGCATIYAPYVTGTAITFETTPPPTTAMAERIRRALRTHAWLVAERDGEVVGYAYGAPFADREAYRWACEVSVYCAPQRRRTGTGRALYDALLTRLTDRGFRTAVARMALPNEASVGLHAAFGFEPVGIQPRIGYKLGDWHDVAISQRTLITGDGPPTEPR